MHMWCIYLYGFLSNQGFSWWACEWHHIKTGRLCGSTDFFWQSSPCTKHHKVFTVIFGGFGGISEIYGDFARDFPDVLPMFARAEDELQQPCEVKAVSDLIPATFFFGGALFFCVFLHMFMTFEDSQDGFIAILPNWWIDDMIILGFSQGAVDLVSECLLNILLFRPGHVTSGIIGGIGQRWRNKRLNSSKKWDGLMETSMVLTGNDWKVWPQASSSP